jgi:transcriptional regulator with XRE-family HTH domain
MRSHPQLNVAGYVRQVRRRTRMSQREIAAACDVHASTISRVEAGRTVIGLATFSRLLRAAGLRLVVVDENKRRVPPLKEPPDTRDLADRQFPAHLDLILDPEPGEWWGDHFGLVRPPETFHRDPAARYAHRVVFNRCRGVLVHGETTDWRQRVIEDRKRYEHMQRRRHGRFLTGTIPYRRSVRTRMGGADNVQAHVRDHYQ